MYRTSEEEQEYRSLSPEERKRYDIEVSLDPSLTHKQVMQTIAITKAVHKNLKEGGRDVDPQQPATQKRILEGVRDFLMEKAPSVWRSVRDSFNAAISYLGELILRGIDWVNDHIVEPVRDFLDDIFS